MPTARPNLFFCLYFRCASDYFRVSPRFRGKFEFQGPNVGGRGVQDSQNRSLRDFDLETRLFQYPCSYLIYSPSFDALPDQVRKPIISRLYEILEGRDDSKKFAHLPAETRQAILEILCETKLVFANKDSASLSEK